MANKIQMVRAELDHQQRSLLLSAFPPRYPNVYCRHLVWAYGVADNFVFPTEPVTFTITGHHVGPGHEALVGIADDGMGTYLHQVNNDRLLHITLSTDDGVAPVKASEILSAGIEPFKPAADPIVLILDLKIGHAVRLLPERR